MSKLFYKTAAVALVALFAVTGCQSIGDMIGQKIGEKVVESATGGNVKIDSNSGNGSMTIKTKDGEAVFGGGEKRPDSAPADLPNVDGAKDFSWIGSQEGGMFGFSVANGDYKAVCTQQMALLTTAGWAADDSFSMDIEKTTSKMMKKEGFSLSVSCSSDDGKATSVALIKGKK